MGMLTECAKQVVSSPDGNMTFVPKSGNCFENNKLQEFLRQNNAKYMAEFSSGSGLSYRIEVTPALREKMQAVLTS
jgi:hypothetical protein